MYSPDDFEEKLWVMKTTKGLYCKNGGGRTKFLRKARISDYMDMYEGGIAAYNEGDRSLQASGIINIKEIADISNVKDRIFIMNYLNKYNTNKLTKGD